MAASSEPKTQDKWQMKSPEDPVPATGIDLSIGFDCEVREGYMNWWICAPDFVQAYVGGRNRIVKGGKSARRFTATRSWSHHVLTPADAAEAFRSIFTSEPQSEILFDGPCTGSSTRSQGEASGAAAASAGPAAVPPSETAEQDHAACIRIEGFVQTACCKFVDRITFEAFELESGSLGSPAASGAKGEPLVSYMLFSRSVSGSFDWNVNEGRAKRLHAALDAKLEASLAPGAGGAKAGAAAGEGSGTARKAGGAGKDEPVEGRGRQPSYGTSEAST